MSAATEMPRAVSTHHLLDMHVDLLAPQVVPGPEGLLLIAVTSGGSFAGDELRGEVLPGGGDWIRVGNDRVARLDVRATLRTDDDELVYITTTGVCRLGDEGIARYWQGETVGWEEAYIRGSIRFQTGAERYAWLNATHTVAMMQLAQDHVEYRVFAVD